MARIFLEEVSDESDKSEVSEVSEESEVSDQILPGQVEHLEGLACIGLLLLEVCALILKLTLHRT